MRNVTLTIKAFDMVLARDTSSCHGIIDIKRSLSKHGNIEILPCRTNYFDLKTSEMIFARVTLSWHDYHLCQNNFKIPPCRTKFWLGHENVLIIIYAQSFSTKSDIELSASDEVLARDSFVLL